MRRFFRFSLKRIFVIFAAMLLFTGGALLGKTFFRGHDSETGISSQPIPAPDETSDLPTVRRNWSKRIDAVGPYQAYEELKKQYDSLGTKAHTYSHLYGGLLYEKLGVEGISVCDSALGFGCFHEFIADAIADRGLSVVPLLSQRCASDDLWTSSVCRHGIGHGVLAFLGYDVVNVSRALDVCMDVEGENIGGCSGGVFMEYNFQTMLQERATTRELHLENPHEPCAELNGAYYRKSCYFWQPEWWGRALSGDMRDKYARIGGFCLAIQNGEEREQCFRGAGNIVGEFSGWNIDEARALCGALGEEGAPWCRLAGADVFFYTKGKNEGMAMCVGLQEQWAVLCLAQAR